MKKFVISLGRSRLNLWSVKLKHGEVQFCMSCIKIIVKVINLKIPIFSLMLMKR